MPPAVILCSSTQCSWLYVIVRGLFMFLGCHIVDDADPLANESTSVAAGKKRGKLFDSVPHQSASVSPSTEGREGGDQKGAKIFPIIQSEDCGHPFPNPMSSHVHGVRT